MGQAEPTTTAALLRRLALPAVFVAMVFIAQLARQSPVLPSVDKVLAVGASVTTEFTGPTMGTSFTVKVRGPELGPEASELLSLGIQGALNAVNDSMSTWRPTSEISRFNVGPARTPFAFSEPTMEVMHLSQRVYEASGGAFDVTVGALVDRWGFGPEEIEGPPTEAELSVLLATVGQDKLVMDGREHTVTKMVPGLHVDLSAVAKGYAVDQVARAIESLGHTSYMVEVGGEVRTGDSGDGSPWRIAVEKPSLLGAPGDHGIFEVLELDGMAMATSGDYRNFIEDGETLRSHSIDPRTGQPVSHNLASVTVVHAQCGEADAWATALMVLGPDAGLQLAESEGLAALFITRSGDALNRSATTHFALFSRLSQPRQPIGTAP